MRRVLGNIVLGLMFVAGLLVLLYPTFSDWYNSRLQAEAVATYNRTYSSMEQEELNALWEAAEAYNETLAQQSVLDMNLTDEEMAEYESILDITGTGMMGYITIESLGVELPIYHGVEEPVLQKYVGHLPGTSLPIGGESTHSVLSGHRGLPTSRLFTDLDQLEEDDVFLLNVLGQTLAYEVDDIQVVEPTEVSGLGIQAGADEVTLVTCTPYGVNTHRLLVTGHRIEYSSRDMIAANGVPLDGWLVTSIVAVPTLALLLVGYTVATRRRRAR